MALIGDAAAAGRVDGSRGARPAGADRSSWPATVGCAGLVALLLAAPYESTTPLLRLPGQNISSVETVLLLVFVAWAAALVTARTLPEWRTALSAPGGLLLAALATAAAAAPSNRTNALHMVGRLALAGGLYLATVAAATTPARARTLMRAAWGSGVAAAALVALDFTHLAAGQALLAPFRAQTAVVGAQVRASGPFQYPTIASMFLEMAFACGVGLLPGAIDRGRRAAMAIALGLLVIAGGVTLTYTRSGLLTLQVTLALAIAWRARRTGFDRAGRWLAAVACAAAAMVPLSRSTEAMRLRLTTEGQDDWYRAAIDAPAHLNLPAGGQIAVRVTVTNTGFVTWDSAAVQPFGFSYHWLLPDADRVVSWEGLRAAFPEPVAPGARVTMTVALEAPRQPGEYRVVWDLFQEDLLWFSTEPEATLTISRATVSGDAVGPPLDPSLLRPMPKPAVRPVRAVLWRAAGRMLAEHPWLGVGPDNFRLLYAPYARLPRPDPRVHTNNMYLELVVGGGAAAGLALLWLMWRVAAVGGRLARRPDGPSRAAATAGVTGAVAAIALHGLVDSFLGFTGTYTAIAVMLGLFVAWDRMPADGPPSA